MADVDDLARLPLAAVDDAPRPPFGGAGDGVAGPPELRSPPRIERVLDQTEALAVPDLPSVLGPELEVEAAVVDAPGAVRLQVDAVLGAGDHLLQAGLARFEVDVGHPDEGDAVPGLGAHRPGARPAVVGRGLSRRHVPAEHAAVDQ